MYVFVLFIKLHTYEYEPITYVLSDDTLFDVLFMFVMSELASYNVFDSYPKPSTIPDPKAKYQHFVLIQCHHILCLYQVLLQEFKHD